MRTSESTQGPSPAPPNCARCQHFDNSPTLLEAAIPGLRTLGSGYGAVRGSDGICQLHDRYLSARYGCDDFKAG